MKVKFIMIYIIDKIPVSLKTTRIFQILLKSIIDIYFLLKNNLFFLTHNDEKDKK